MQTTTDARNNAMLLAYERDYARPELHNGRLLVTASNGQRLDYVQAILAPRGLLPHDHNVSDWHEAGRVLGMLPPVR